MIEAEEILIYFRKERSWHVWRWVNKQDGGNKGTGEFGDSDQGNCNWVKKYSQGKSVGINSKLNLGLLMIPCQISFFRA